jgi:hypothetical protein
VPCFHTHWLVALGAVDNAPKYIGDGCKSYVARSRAYSKACYAALDGLAAIRSKEAKASFEKAMTKARDNWKIKLDEDDASSNGAITCFSAYMLGACGPDFWMLPAEPTSWIGVPSFAAFHFDLGHYNRTHRQFELSIQDVGGKDKADLQTRVQRSYFLGMATHIAADLVIHQLVNVTAGAYNLLEHRGLLYDKVWENEHGGAWGLNLFNTHNKVEHFWDSYVRYRCLGDYGAFWPAQSSPPPASGPHDDTGWTEPLGLPTLDGLVRRAKGNDVVWSQSKSLLGKHSTRFEVEKPLMFPWYFCDRVLAGKAGGLSPFVYQIVVDKTQGSYRTSELSGTIAKEAGAEANDAQMNRPKFPPKTEAQKLAFFSSARNQDMDPTSFNFLTFKVCPNVERTRLYARDVFYDNAALGPFVNAGIAAAGTFLGELSNAYESGKVNDLDKLRRFWNLDTGLGLRVKKATSDTDRESIALLDFVHVFDELGTGGLAYTRREPYLAPTRGDDKKPTQKKSIQYKFTEAHAFQTYAHDPPFEDIESVYEDSDSKYLERIPVGSQAPTSSKSEPLWTSSIKAENKLVCRSIKKRLTLCFRAAIADLKVGGQGEKHEELALFFLGDNAGKPGKPATGETREWLAKHSKILDYRDKPNEIGSGLQSFTTRLLVNLEKEKVQDRLIAKGAWNNVVPYDKNMGSYGRNFAISTGRRFVLHPTDGGGFNPFTDFAYYNNVSPTEHVFFTLYPLVKDGSAYYDAFSKTPFTSAQVEDLKKIDGCGTVKIVLIYESRADGALDLSKCFIDALEAGVEG